MVLRVLGRAAGLGRLVTGARPFGSIIGQGTTNIIEESTPGEQHCNNKVADDQDVKYLRCQDVNHNMLPMRCSFACRARIILP